MQIQVLIPSQNQRSFTVNVDRDETVASFRKLLCKTLKVAEDTFLLIAMGKIMIDTCLDKKPATLFSTYRVKDKTCVFVHITGLKRKQVVTEKIKEQTTANKRRKIKDIIRYENVVSMPFDDFVCPVCNNDTKKKSCRECGCEKCHLKTGDPLICDQCDGYWHLSCAGLSKTPTEQYWYCPNCINNDDAVIVGKGKAMQSTHQQTIHIRDDECILVPVWHAGKIPGVYCGQTWECRSTVYDWGVHRSTRYATCGSINTGAVSLVLSSNNSLDKDVGYEFIYHGRPDYVSKDDCLSGRNLSLATTCDAAVNSQVGARATNWRQSRPVRVCRASTVNNEFAPEEGIRYDGLYKLVKYWPEQGNSVKPTWKFLFRRDDQEAPPWSSTGRGLMTKRGLTMVRGDPELTEKKMKYVISNRVQRLMSSDSRNKRLWNQVKKIEFWSEYEFLHYIFNEAVVCSSYACSKPIKDPITTPCGHICCIKCLNQSNSDRCFTCRAVIPPNAIQVNTTLLKILKTLNWAYDVQPSVPQVKTEEPIVKQEFTQPKLTKRARVVIECLGN